MNKYAFPAITRAAFQMNQLDEALIQSVLSEYSKSNKEAVYAYAKERKILPFVAFLLARLGQNADYWAPVVASYEARNRQIIAGLDAVFSKMTEADVKKLFLSQNFGALLVGGKNVSLFASGDADLCGALSEKETIDEVFRILGFQQSDRFCGKKLISSDYNNDTLLPAGFTVGVEYDTLSRLKLPNPIDMENFVDWSRMQRYQDTSIVLPPLDALTYICLVHISLHSFSRAPDIRLYVDIENSAAAKPDWEQVIAYAEREKTVIRILSAVAITKKLFGLTVPDTVNDILRAYDQQIERVLRLVYNQDKNELIYEPGGLKTLRIETVYYDDSNAVRAMLFPRKDWMDSVYGGHGVGAHVRHAVNLFK